MKKILVIDDDAALRTLLGRVFKSRHEMFFAQDGMEGLEMAERILPDLVLLDIDMPRMDGLSLCGLLKKREPTANIPILFLTSENRIGIVEDALKEGASGYVTKPFDFNRLAEKVEELLKPRG